MGGGVLFSNGGADVGEFGLRIGIAHELEDSERFVDAVVRGGPARAAGNAEQKHEEDDSRKCGDTDLPTPLCRAQMQHVRMK